MSAAVTFTEAAREDVDAADAWWRVNRPSAPDAVLDELRRAIALLAERPGIGVAIRGTRHVETRKLVLREIKYVLYYRVTGGGVQVLRVWHASRRAPPRW